MLVWGQVGDMGLEAGVGSELRVGEWSAGLGMSVWGRRAVDSGWLSTDLVVGLAGG
jgi:hypothetical protein